MSDTMTTRYGAPLGTITAIAGLWTICTGVLYEPATIVLAANTILGTVILGFGTVTAYLGYTGEPVAWFLPAPAAVCGIGVVGVAFGLGASGALLYGAVAGGATATIAAGTSVLLIVLGSGPEGASGGSNPGQHTD